MIDDLLAELRTGGDGAKEAARTLGLLIERGSRGPASDDQDIVEMLPPELADGHLTAAERQAAIDGLIAYVDGEPLPLPLAVWALSKSFDERIAPALIALLERTVDDPEHEHLAYQALTGMIPLGGPEVEKAVRDAAERGHDRVRDGARQYLSINDPPEPP
jgi:hypothetical protein